MNLFFSMAEALDMIRSNKLRSFLTMLGMNIGVAAIIAVVSLGLMAREEIMGQVDDIGSAIIWVEPDFSVYPNRDEVIRIQMEDYDNLLKVLKGGELIPYRNGREEVGYRSYTATGRITAVSGNYRDVFPLELRGGRFFSERENRQKRPVAVLGSHAAGQWFGDEDPLGRDINIAGRRFRVIGVLKERPQGLMSDGTSDETIYLPLSSYQNLSRQEYGQSVLSLLIFRAPSMDRLDDYSRVMKNYFYSRYGQYRRQDRFSVNQARQEIEQFNRIFGVITTVVSLIAGISLLVSGIGIMNIMLMAITERTREIGIRKAIGARREDILQQFLIEAVIICLLGGGIGVILGLLLSLAVAATQDWSFVVPLFSVVGGLAVSLAVGLFFGIYPAFRAASLPPIQALGRE